MTRTGEMRGSLDAGARTGSSQGSGTGSSPSSSSGSGPSPPAPSSWAAVSSDAQPLSWEPAFLLGCLTLHSHGVHKLHGVAFADRMCIRLLSYIGGREDVNYDGMRHWHVRL